MNRRKVVQQKLGLERIAATTKKLADALDRMRNSKDPVVWTKQTLAKEAGVNESTLFRKDNGKHIYAEILEAFESSIPVTSKVVPRDERDLVIAQLKERNRKLELSIGEMGRELQVYKDKERNWNVRKQNSGNSDTAASK